jgi:ribosomal protein L14E/L6E/L27E
MQHVRFMTRILFATVLVFGLAAPAMAEPSDPNDVAGDRSRAVEARKTVDVDAKLVDVEVQRVSELKIAWDHAVAQGHPDEAAHFAKLHSEELANERRAEEALRTARQFLNEARERLRGDEFRQQNLQNT